MKNLDEARNSFDFYKRNYQTFITEDLSESDTRSKLIDKLLIEVLGWDEEDIRREGHVRSGYFDYKVSIPAIYFIVEAKKQFKELVLPTNHKRALIKSLYIENKDVIDQIQKYSIDEGIQYGVITNGWQFVFLKTINNDGKPWKNNSCLIFNGMLDIENRFIEFYENLSKYSIINNGGFKFDLPTLTLQYKTILSTLYDKDKELIRNSLSAKIAPIIDNIFGEIFSEEREDDIEFIKHCFVENEETKKNKNEIERLFGDEAPNLANVIPAVNSNNIAKQIGDEIISDDITIKNNYPPKPIVIIGSKGAGKTTFINNLFKYKLSDLQLESHFIVYIDFRKFFESEVNFEPPRIAKEILTKLYDRYESLELYSLKVLKRIYFKEIHRNDESIWLYDKENNPASYNEKLSKFLDECKTNSLEHIEFLSKYLIRERRKRLVVIIDNADQFNDDIQKKIFVFAHSLTKSSLCGTVISLREGYYYKWQNSPPFDAYESNIYHITAPNYIEILQKRIDFALEKCKVAREKVRGINEKGIKWEFSSDDIFYFLSTLKVSLFSTENSQIIDFLSQTTYPNIREGLRVFKSFLTSGHTKVTEYILREKHRAKNQVMHSVIPLHEFIKSIGLQNRHYFNSEASIIYNLYLPPVDTADHFLKLYILQDLNEIIEKKTYTEKMVSSSFLIEKLNTLGYRLNSINDAISSLIKNALVDADEQLSDVEWTELPSHYNLFLTLKGHYYLKELVNRFHYYDLIIQDTPIFDIPLFENIKAEFPLSNAEGNRNLYDRIKIVNIFLGYLKNMEAKQPSQTRMIYGNFMNPIIKNLETEIRKMPIQDGN
jgi:GTPase SAR1 family protein